MCGVHVSGRVGGRRCSLGPLLVSVSMWSCYIACIVLEYTILLPQLSEYWDYRSVPACLADDFYIGF